MFISLILLQKLRYILSYYSKMYSCIEIDNVNYHLLFLETKTMMIKQLIEMYQDDNNCSQLAVQLEK